MEAETYLKRSRDFTSGNFIAADIQEARTVAKILFDQFDKNRNSVLDLTAVREMEIEAYRRFNKSYNPTNEETEAYQKVLDRDRNGIVTLSDIEELCIKYLCSGRVELFEKKEVAKHHGKVIKTIKYNDFALRQLDVAKRLFLKYDSDKSGKLSRQELAPLLADTNREIRKTNVLPTTQEVNQTFDFIDRDRDGIITLEDYEFYIIDSFKKNGIPVEDFA